MALTLPTPEIFQKRCKECYQVKLLIAFEVSNKTLDGRKSRCAACRIKHNKRERERYVPGSYDKARTRKNYLKRVYGLSLESYEALLKKQNYRCAICRTDDPGNRSFIVDHDHACCVSSLSCGKCLRGLLCWNCNIALGHLKDSSEIVAHALNYLLGSAK